VSAVGPRIEDRDKFRKFVSGQTFQVYAPPIDLHQAGSGRPPVDRAGPAVCFRRRGDAAQGQRCLGSVGAHCQHAVGEHTQRVRAIGDSAQRLNAGRIHALGDNSEGVSPVGIGTEGLDALGVRSLALLLVGFVAVGGILVKLVGVLGQWRHLRLISRPELFLERRRHHIRRLVQQWRVHRFGLQRGPLLYQRREGKGRGAGQA
jgi:hypothetical protein